MKLTAKSLRDSWIHFFESRGHKVIASHSVIPPKEDKSTLFVNAGLCVLKKEFISQGEERVCQSFTSVQKVIRTVDIESIEKDGWHSTYFEMMGNFSVGSYFKKEAISYSVEFLDQFLKLDLSKLVITVHKDDLESEVIWRNLLGEEVKILKMDKENFWEVGDGPCGPCTEIYYDRGQEFDPENKYLELLEKSIDNERFIEIWNIVFSQYWAENGNYIELKNKNIDTGAGLERVVSILENSKNVFFSSLFYPIIQEIESISLKKYSSKLTEEDAQFQVIADHLRTSIILLGEELTPSGKGRGYVLRKLMRRIFVALFLLDVKHFEEHLPTLIQKTLNVLSGLYPELQDRYSSMLAEFLKENLSFQKVLNNCYGKINHILSSNKEKLEEQIFTLVEREGSPLPVIRKICKDNNVQFSEEILKNLMEQHSQKSKNVKFSNAFNLKI
ncbi:alanyl-tRNA synthetase [Mycoplasma ovis str. Michigan]|uniref:alanine--tRNA ligase n=1 Tax=Mycoplasma ovis str. Michigan TaxID=1415773 RepID=A0ABM5P0F7_9MOLU|nr:alanine--tRNA ligase-related protein [Mycoplasma ovis]AHC39892.1 alanyl-tRNA synthetase [Mycoplasma ovis str. Michigan]